MRSYLLDIGMYVALMALRPNEDHPKTIQAQKWAYRTHRNHEIKHHSCWSSSSKLGKIILEETPYERSSSLDQQMRELCHMQHMLLPFQEIQNISALNEFDDYSIETECNDQDNVPENQYANAIRFKWPLVRSRTGWAPFQLAFFIGHNSQFHQADSDHHMFRTWMYQTPSNYNLVGGVNTL